MPIAFSLRAAVHDPVVARRYAWFCAMRFGLFAAATASLLFWLTLIDELGGAAESPLITAFVTVLIGSSGAALSSVAWIMAFRDRGPGPQLAKGLAYASSWLWLIGSLSTVAVAVLKAHAAGPSSLAFLILGAILLIAARPPFLLHRIAHAHRARFVSR